MSLIANPQTEAQYAFNNGGQMPVTLSMDVPGIGQAGQTLMLALTPADVHDPSEMPTFLQGYRNAEFRADEASPVVLRDQDSDKYRRFDEDATFRPVKVKGSINGAIPEVDVGTVMADYSVVDRFIGGFVNDITAQNATAYRPRAAVLKKCSNALMLDREIDAWTLLTTSANWHASVQTTLAAAYKWNGGASADPIGDIQTRLESSLARITDIWMNLRVANAFLRNSTVKDWFKQWLGDGAVDGAIRSLNTAVASPNMVDFTIPGIPATFHVVAAKVQGASSIDYIMGNHVVFTRRPPGGQPADGEDIATSYTFRRRGAAGVGFMTREFRVEGRGPQGGSMVVVSQADIAKMVGPKVGGLILNAYQ